MIAIYVDMSFPKQWTSTVSRAVKTNLYQVSSILTMRTREFCALLGVRHCVGQKHSTTTTENNLQQG